MRPAFWNPPIELSATEQTVVKWIRRAKLFVFLRLYRHEVFDETFQAELAEGYAESMLGQPPVPPAQLALALILQAYTGVSDDEVIEASVMDRRWQLVLDCLDCESSPFSKGTLVGYRTRLIERTVEVAARHHVFGARQLRAALDSSPLWGAGRVEDTYNLLGHALRKALSVIARQQGWGLAAVTEAAGADVLNGSSLKAALDMDWDDPSAREQALAVVLHTLGAVEAYAAQLALDDKTSRAAAESLAAARQVQAQDVTTNEQGQPVLRDGVAKDRRISLEDPDMRHGRKSKSRLFDGYKRHVLCDLDSGLVRAVGLTPANAPEASVTEAIVEDLAQQKVTLRELHIDRAYLSSALVRNRPPDLAIYCKAWPVQQGAHFAKTAFELDWEHQLIRCPNGLGLAFEPGGIVNFPAEVCAACTTRSLYRQLGRAQCEHPPR